MSQDKVTLRIPKRAAYYSAACTLIGVLAGATMWSTAHANLNDKSTQSIVDATKMVVPYDGKFSVGGAGITGNRNVTFELYDAATGGSQVWQETQDVMFSEGKFSVNLGAINGLQDEILDAETVYLQVTVEEFDSNGAPVLVGFAGRQRIAPAPFAAWSYASADFVADGDVTVATGQTTTLSGATTITNDLVIDGSENDGSSAALRINNSDNAQYLLIDGDEIDGDVALYFQHQTRSQTRFHGDLSTKGSVTLGDAYTDSVYLRGYPNDGSKAALTTSSASGSKMLIGGKIISTTNNETLHLNSNSSGDVVIGGDVQAWQAFRPSYMSYSSTRRGDGGAVIVNDNNAHKALMIVRNDSGSDNEIRIYDDLHVEDELTVDLNANTSAASTFAGNVTINGDLTVGGTVSRDTSCPSNPRANIYNATTRSRLCVYQKFSGSGPDWNDGADDCWSTWGAEMCTYNQMRLAATQGNYNFNQYYWMRDRVANNRAISSNRNVTSTSNRDNFDGDLDYGDTQSGSFCCLVIQGH